MERKSVIIPLDHDSLSPQKALERLGSQAYRILLHSNARSDRQGRFSFLGVAPFVVLQSSRDTVTLAWQDRVETLTEDPFSVIRRLLNRYRTDPNPLHIPFSGGLMGVFSYDLARRIERLPDTAVWDLSLPDLYLMFFDIVIAWDHTFGAAWLIHTVYDDLPDRHLVRQQVLDALTTLDDLSRYADTAAEIHAGEPISNLGRSGYIDLVQRCKSYIASGDIFQANLSHRLSARLIGYPPETVYERFRSINPSSYAGAFLCPEFSVLSTSPERLVYLNDSRVETRPIAGTRPHGSNSDENLKWKTELLSSPKERAEHVMLVDLERNDLGRVCRYRSIQVDQWMTTETYSHVTHIVSNIRGVLKPGLDALDVLKAVFPGGTITGVPKVRCMEIIEELEPVKRGPYSGSLGYISFSGNMDLNILIRTILLIDGTAHYQVGAGIVADSLPDSEYEETLHKANAFFELMNQLRCESTPARPRNYQKSA